MNLFSLYYRQKNSVLRKVTSSVVAFFFFLNLTFIPVSGVSAQFLPNLPQPGTMLGLTGHFESTTLLGMTLHPENPLLFDFLIDRGQDKITGEDLKGESEKLIKFFLASMTIPDNDSWVNLSPYEKDRIMPDLLATTDMGKTMLEQDYLLKQLSASLTNPEKDLGKKFWEEVQKKAFERFGTTEMPMNTFNKVWIVPQSALVLEHEGYVLVGESHLKVMLDQDYVAMQYNPRPETTDQRPETNSDVAKLSSEVFRDTILPQLEKEVNEGKTFAPVRQIYHSVILATWYKKNLKESLLGKVYVDKNKIAGVNISEKDIKEKIYQQYLEAFRKGVYNLIKEDEDLATKETLPRKYFSGGLGFEDAAAVMRSEQIGNGARASSSARESMAEIESKANGGRVASASVTMADNRELAKSLGDRIANTEKNTVSSAAVAGSAEPLGRELFGAFYAGKATFDWYMRSNAQKLAQKHEAEFLGYGGRGYSFKFYISGQDIVVKYLPDYGPSADDIDVFQLAKGNPLFQQYISYKNKSSDPGVPGEGTIGWIASEFIKGKPFISPRPDKKKQLPNGVQTYYDSGLLQEITQIPDQHWDQLIQIFKDAKDLGIFLNISPANFLYDPKDGFKVVNYSKGGNGIPLESQLMNSLPIIVGYRGQPGFKEFIKAKITERLLAQGIIVPVNRASASSAVSFLEQKTAAGQSYLLRATPGYTDISGVKDFLKTQGIAEPLLVDAERLFDKYLPLADIKLFSDMGENEVIADYGSVETGSFKPWIAYSILKAVDENPDIQTIVGATTGNQGIAMSWIVTQLNDYFKKQGSSRRLVAKIYINGGASAEKIAIMEKNGATIVREVQGKTFANYDEAFFVAMEAANADNLYSHFVFHADQDAMASYAYLGKRTLRSYMMGQGLDLDNSTAILIPLGTGGLASGIAIAAKMINPNVKIILVQTDATQHGYISLRDGVLSKYEGDQAKASLVDGNDTKTMEPTAFELLKGLADGVFLVNSEDVLPAIREFNAKGHSVEGAGVTTHIAYKNLSPEFVKLGITKVLSISTGRNGMGDIKDEELTLSDAQENSVSSSSSASSGRQLSASSAITLDLPGNGKAFLDAVESILGVRVNLEGSLITSVTVLDRSKYMFAKNAAANDKSGSLKFELAAKIRKAVRGGIQGIEAYNKTNAAARIIVDNLGQLGEKSLGDSVASSAVSERYLLTGFVNELRESGITAAAFEKVMGPYLESYPILMEHLESGTNNVMVAPTLNFIQRLSVATLPSALVKKGTSEVMTDIMSARLPEIFAQVMMQLKNPASVSVMNFLQGGQSLTIPLSFTDNVRIYFGMDYIDINMERVGAVEYKERNVSQGTEFTLGNPIMVGRATPEDLTAFELVSSDPTVSRKHFSMEVTQGENRQFYLKVTDQKSLYGTLVTMSKRGFDPSMKKDEEYETQKEYWQNDLAGFLQKRGVNQFDLRSFLNGKAVDKVEVAMEEFEVASGIRAAKEKNRSGSFGNFKASSFDTAVRDFYLGVESRVPMQVTRSQVNIVANELLQRLYAKNYTDEQIREYANLYTGAGQVMSKYAGIHQESSSFLQSQNPPIDKMAAKKAALRHVLAIIDHTEITSGTSAASSGVNDGEPFAIDQVSSSAIIISAPETAKKYYIGNMISAAKRSVDEINAQIQAETDKFNAEKGSNAKPKFIDLAAVGKAITQFRTYKESTEKLPRYAQQAFIATLRIFAEDRRLLSMQQITDIWDNFDQALLGNDQSFTNEFLLNGNERLMSPLREGDQVIAVSASNRFGFSFQDGKLTSETNGAEIQNGLYIGDKTLQVHKLMTVDGKPYIGIKHLPASKDSAYVLIKSREALDIKAQIAQPAAPDLQATQKVPAPVIESATPQVPVPAKPTIRVINSRQGDRLENGNTRRFTSNEIIHLLLPDGGNPDGTLKNIEVLIKYNPNIHKVEISGANTNSWENPEYLTPSKREIILGKNFLKSHGIPSPEFVSRSHVKVTWVSDDVITLTDLNSSNGSDAFAEINAQESEGEQEITKFLMPTTPVVAVAKPAETTPVRAVDRITEYEAENGDDTLPPNYNDSASSGVNEVGGINFDPTLFDLQIKRDGKGVPLPLPQQNLEQINIEGLYPVILNIKPATMQNFPFIISALDQKEALVVSN